MILIGQYDSPFVRRVAIAMLHYGLTFEHRPWSVWAQADVLATYNPLRRVPVLVRDDGEVLVESGAILDALDEGAPEPLRLAPVRGPKRRATLRVCALATGLAEKAVSLLYERVLRAEDTQSEVWTKRCTGQLGDTLDWLETERSAIAEAFWFGTFSHADVAVASALQFIREAHPVVWEARSRPALLAHANHCEALPLFQKVQQPLHIAM